MSPVLPFGGCVLILTIAACLKAGPATQRERASESFGVPSKVAGGCPSTTVGLSSQTVDRSDADLSSDSGGVAEAGRLAVQREWTPQPQGSRVLMFREAQVGMLANRGQRTTWTFITSGVSVLVRVEKQQSFGRIPHLDPESIRPDKWLAPTRTEYAGVATAQVPPFTLRLQRNFGTREPEELLLNCANKTIQVHPALATLVEGWKNDDDTMAPASWAPARTEPVRVLNCRPAAALWTFSDGLSFGRGRLGTAKNPELLGVEWGFVNSDMVIQEGGYRWILSGAL